MNKYLKISIGSFLIFTSNANAQLDYCELSERKVEINYFSHSYKEKSQLSPVLNSTSEILNSLEMGDQIVINQHINGTQKTLKVCKPGCPENGFLNDLLDSTCSTQVAKKDLISFNQLIKKQLKKVVDSVNTNFDIYEDFNSFNIIAKNSRDTETIVFHSFVPYEVNIADPSSFDKFFVNSVNDKDLSSVSIPELNYIAKEEDSKVIKLWNDLSLNGHVSGIKGTRNIK
jgi:hypothetical protein